MLEANYQYINELVERVQTGNVEALAEIEQFYQPLIVASINRCIVREPRLRPYREDIENEIFLILQHLVKIYDPVLSYFSYYLSTRLDHAILGHCRKNILGVKTAGTTVEEINFSDMPLDWEPEAQEDPFGKIRFAHAIHDAVDAINPRQQEAIQLYFFDNLTQHEAAKKLNITQASFCKRLQRGITKLKELLSEEFSDF